jgi:outer membrane protein assembly factor BamB
MLRLLTALGSLVLVQLLVSGTASAAPSDWPVLLRNAAHNSDSPSQALQASTASTIGINWMSPLHSPDLGSPVAAYNSVLKKTVAYVGDDNGDVFAFDEATGAELWSTSLGYRDSLRATPAVGPDGSVWVGTSYNPRLWALNGATGAVECSVATPLTIDSSPDFGTPPGGSPMVYVASIDSETVPGPVYGIRQTNCNVLWSFSNYGEIDGSWASPAFGIDATGKARVYIGTADANATMWALDAKTGKLIWSYAPGFPPGDYDFGAGATISPPGANGFADGVLYAPSTYGELFALDLTTGHLVWSYTFDPTHGLTGSGRSSAALDGTTLVLGAADGAVAVDATTGALIWHYVDPSHLESISSPAIVGPPGNKIAVFGDLAGTVHALRLTDGADLYDFQTLNYITSSPAIVNGHVLIDSADGFLYDFKTGGAQSGAPTTAIASPANGANVPNPAGALTATGSASDTVGLQSVSVSVQSGAANGPWYDGATQKWVRGPVNNLVNVASPGQLQSAWSFSFPVPPAGSTYRLMASAVDANHFDDRVGAQSSFTVLSSKNATLQLSVSSAYVAPAGSITASASGFAPNETIVFALQGGTVAQAAANSAGSVSNVPIDVPASAAFGPSSLKATGKSSHDATSTTLEIANAWTQGGYSAKQTGYEPNDEIFWKTLEPGNSYLSHYWTYQTGAPVDASPAVVAGTAYVANDAGTVAAVDTANGIPLWTYATPTKSAIRGAPAVSNGTVLFSTEDGSLYGVSATNGGLLGSTALDGVPTAPVVSGSTAFVGSDNGSVYAVDISSGQVLWTATVPAAVTVAPAVDTAKGLVFAGDDAGNVTILSAATGALVGSVSTGGAAVTVAPELSAGMLLVGGADGFVRAFKESSGTLEWTFAAPAAIGGLSSDGVSVYAGSADGTVSYLTQSNGQLSFAVNWGSAVVGVSSAYFIAFGETSSGLVFGRKNFNPIDRVRWEYQTGAGLTTTPTLVDGALFVGAEDGGLYAFTFYGLPPQDERMRRENARIRNAAKTPHRWARPQARRAIHETAHAFGPFGPRVFPLHVDRSGAVTSAAIRYHGGPLQSSPRRYAIIWGGLQARRTEAPALAALRAHGPLAGVAVDRTAPSHFFDDADVQRELEREITRNGWPAGLGAQFIVLTADGPARNACSYHSAFDLHGALRTPVVYGVVQTAQTSACGGLPAVLARERVELETDPLLDGWHDAAGNERMR